MRAKDFTIPVFASIWENIYKLVEEESFDNEKERFLFRDKCFHFIFLLLERKVYENESLLAYTGMHSKFLEKELGTRYAGKVQRYLENARIIKKNEKYKSAGFPQSFAFVGNGEIFLEYQELVDYKFTCQSVVKKLLNADANFNKDLEPFLQEYFEKVILKHSINEMVLSYLKNAKSWDDNYQIIEAFVQIRNILRGKMFINRKVNGRLYHNFNQLNKIFRGFILNSDIGKTLDLVEVDISSCQPYLFSSFLRREHAMDGSPAPKDLIIFHEMTLKKDFYTSLYNHLIYSHTIEESDLLEITGMEKYNRNLFKDIVIKIFNWNPVYANSRQNDLYEFYYLLKSEFPTVYNKVEKINLLVNSDNVNKRGSNKVGELTEGLESQIMIDVLIPKLLELRITGFTIHDGILVSKEHAETVKTIIQDGFNQLLGYKPYVKIK